MRDLAKSMIRCSWAVSMLGAREVTSLLTGSRKSPMRTLDALSHTAEDQLGETASGLYRAGEQFQNGMVEAIADLASGSWSDPAGAINKGLRQGWEAVDRSWSNLRNPR